MVLMPHWPKSPLISCNRNDLVDIKKILDNLGNPEKSLPPIIHVAGTNGKASTISFLQGIFTSANYKIHAHMSPHIHRCNERIIIAGEEVSDDYLHQILEEVRLNSGNINLTFSEAMIIESEQIHEERFKDIGCDKFYKWFQCYNFVSWVLIK